MAAEVNLSGKVNKVVYDGNVLIDLTSDTVTADDMAEGVTAHAADGSTVTGVLLKATIDDALSLTSTNPVQNKIVTQAISSRLSVTGTAAKAKADADGNIITSTYAKVTDVATDEEISELFNGESGTGGYEIATSDEIVALFN